MEENMVRCLVTGVAGFIGSHLAERLLRDGHEVCGVDDFSDYYPRWIKERNLAYLRHWQRFTFVEGDLLSLDVLPLFEDAAWIFHQAGQAGVRGSWGEEFARYVDCNVLVTQRLLDAAVHCRHIERFVYASSSSVYGNSIVMPLAESLVPHPLSPYGVTKLAAEHLCNLYFANFGVPTVSLRYFTVYGPRQRPDMAFHRFCKALIAHQSIHLYGDGQQTRSFTFVSDVVEANILAATTEKVVGETFNVAGGASVSLYEVVRLLQGISGVSTPISFDNEQHGDVRHIFASMGLAKRLLGYQPMVSLEDGLEQEFRDIAALYPHERLGMVEQQNQAVLS
jgi:nucleoside-diphosphate-sugar epimerase